MTRRLKIIAFAAILAGFAMMASTYNLGFDIWPPQARLADGTSEPFRTAEVQACFKARVVALLGERDADRYW